MPTNLSPEIPAKKEYDLLPEDTYEVIVESMEDDTRTKYKSEEEEQYIKFTFRFLDPELSDRKIWDNVTPKLFAGKGSQSPSKLYSILCAVNGQYSEDDLSQVTNEDINALEGKKLRVLVTQKKNQEGELRNRISNYLAAKKTEAEKAFDEADKPDNSAPTDEDVAESEVPF